MPWLSSIFSMGVAPGVTRLWLNSDAGWDLRGDWAVMELISRSTEILLIYVVCYCLRH